MKMVRSLLIVLAFTMSLAAEKRVITPANGVPPVGPYSPGILVGDYLYVSGQGAAKPEGGFPATVEEQTAQCLTNVRRIVEAAGLTMQHIVYATVYLHDLSGVDEMNRAWRAAFPADPPARVVVGTAKMPVDTPVEVTVVAARDLASRTAVEPAENESRGVMTADRVYLSGARGPEATFDVLKGASVDHKNIVFANSYTAPPVYTAIATRETPKKSGRCILAGDTLYCPAQSGSGGNIEAQVRSTMAHLRDELRQAGMTFENVVATNVYLDDIGDFARMNKVYAESFGATPPTRTTVQLLPSTGKPLVRIAVVAVR
jgi:2-iminobutanoate/2-iminopropanoate deaminase